MTSLSIIIPAYNESDGIQHTAKKIRPVITELQKIYDVEVIFVNDGSSDNTGELLTQEFSNDDYVKVVSYSKNKGLGGAVRTGFESSTGEIVVTTDFDGTYDFATIAKIVSRLDETEADMVVASPYHPDGHVEGVPKYRLLFSYGASLLYRMVVKWDLFTWTALYRAFRRPVIENVSYTATGFLSTTQMLINAIDQGYQVAEFPTVLSTRQFGQSSIRIAQVTKAHLTYQWSLLSVNRVSNRAKSIVQVPVQSIIKGVRSVATQVQTLGQNTNEALNKQIDAVVSGTQSIAKTINDAVDKQITTLSNKVRSITKASSKHLNLFTTKSRTLAQRPIQYVNKLNVVKPGKPRLS